MHHDPDLTPLLRRIQASGPEGKLVLQNLCARHRVDPAAGVELLTWQITLDGANTMASIIRLWQGVPYREVVHDVARKLKVKVHSADDVPTMERAILTRVADQHWERLGEDERADLQAQLDTLQPGLDFQRLLTALKGGAAIGATLFQEAVITAMAAMFSRFVLREAGKQAALRFAGALVPGLSFVLATWTVVDITGPAYRRTIPTVVELALLRLRYGEQLRAVHISRQATDARVG